MNSAAQHEKVRKVFDRWAQLGRAEGMEQGHGPSAREAFERLELGLGGRYLDVGCGNGYTVRWAAKGMPEGLAVGLDLSSEMVALARTASVGFNNTLFVNESFPSERLHAPEIKGQGFDGIFSMEAFYYFPDLDSALGDVRRLLRPGGRFVCVVDFYQENEASHSWPKDLDVPMTLLSESGWRQAFEAAGLRVLEQGRIGRGNAEGWKLEEGSLMTVGTL